MLNVIHLFRTQPPPAAAAGLLAPISTSTIRCHCGAHIATPASPIPRIGHHRCGCQTNHQFVYITPEQAAETVSRWAAEDRASA